MWITRQRPAAHPRPWAELDRLEVRLLLASATGSVSNGLADPASPLDAPVASPSASDPAIGRIDTYQLAATSATPQILIQVQWQAADPTQGNLIIVTPSLNTQAAYNFDASVETTYGDIFTIHRDDGTTYPQQLEIQFSLDPSMTVAGSSTSGTYDLRAQWISALATGALQPPGTISAPTGSVAVAGGAASSPTGATTTLTGATTSPTGAAGSSEPPASTLPVLDIRNKPMPAPDATAHSPWTVQGFPGVGQIPISWGVNNAPAENPSFGPREIPSPLSPGIIAGPSTSGAATGLVGPFLPPVGFVWSTVPGVTPLPAPHSDARSLAPGSLGDDAGPALIVGPVPLGRSDPNGGIFAHSFTSTANHGNSGSVELSGVPTNASGFAQATTELPRWSGSLSRSSLDCWLVPLGGDGGNPGFAPNTAAPSNPLAAGSPADTRSAVETVLLPTIGAEAEMPLDSGRSTLPTTLSLGAAAALAAEPPVAVATLAEPLPLLASPPSKGTDKSHPRRWGWPALTLTALTTTAVMIFRLYARNPNSDDDADDGVGSLKFRGQATPAEPD